MRSNNKLKKRVSSNNNHNDRFECGSSYHVKLCQRSNFAFLCFCDLFSLLSLSMNRKILIVLVCVCFCVVSVFGGSCFPFNGTSRAAPHGNRLCPQYNSDTCCADSAVFEQITCTIDDGCAHSQGCFDLKELVQCGLQCKPDFYNNFVTFDACK
jgi:hypothetical protein